MAYTIDRRSEGKNSTTKQAKYARAWRKKHEANGMCIKCGLEPVGAGKKTCPSCVDKAIISQRKTHFRNHLAEHGIEKDYLDDNYQMLHDLRELLTEKHSKDFIKKKSVYLQEDHLDFVDRLINAFDSAVLVWR